MYQTMRFIIAVTGTGTVKRTLAASKKKEVPEQFVRIYIS